MSISKLFTYVDIMNWEIIRDEILPIIPESLLTGSSSSVSYPPEVFEACRKNSVLMTEFRRLGLIDFWHSTGIVVVKPNGALPIHTDTGRHIWSLNIPMLNCSGSSTVFYEVNAEPVFTPPKNGTTAYNKFPSENCIEIDRFTLDRPALLRVNLPHNVVNLTVAPRIALAFRLSSEFNIASGNF